MTPSILSLCARIEAHDLQRCQLVTACNNFRQWGKLLYQAEEQGMGPLLHMHLAAIEKEVPDTFLRGLRFLSLRHQQANILMMKSLHLVLSILEAEGIPSLVLKGAALCQTLYPRIGLRPMRDIDLLLAREDVHHAHALLQREGFRAPTADIPKDYLHLPPLYQRVDDMQICIELHHGLFPDDPPYYQPLSFAKLHQNGLTFEVNGITAYTLATEEMLWHLYQHGFHAPLTYEPYRLISAADIVSLVEDKVKELDWEKITVDYPQLFRALSLFHYLTPWNNTVLTKFSFKEKTALSGVGESFKGWPQLKLTQWRAKGIVKSLHLTFFPPQWWLMLYYSTGGDALASIWCRLVRHPVHILRWMKIYGSIFLQKNKSPISPGVVHGNSGSRTAGRSKN